MAIATLADYMAAPKQRVQFTKTNSGSGGGNSCRMFSTWTATGVPPAGSFAIGNTANGLVPDNTTTGAGAINAFSGTGYLTAVDYVACGQATNPQGARAALFDRLFHCGTYSFNASQSLSSQPSYSARVPGTTDYTGLGIWIETVTGWTGQCTIAVTYTDQDGNAGATTGTVALATPGSPPGVGTIYPMPLASGDCGVQKIESVTSTVTSAGTFNVLVLRQLWSAYSLVSDFCSGNPSGLDKSGLVIIPSTACLMYGLFGQNPNVLTEAYFEIASG